MLVAEMLQVARTTGENDSSQLSGRTQGTKAATEGMPERLRFVLEQARRRELHHFVHAGDPFERGTGPEIRRRRKKQLNIVVRFFFQSTYLLYASVLFPLQLSAQPISPFSTIV
jgi:hypothetical protein